MGTIAFEDGSEAARENYTSVAIDEVPPENRVVPPTDPYPPPIIPISETKKTEIINYIEDWLHALKQEQEPKLHEWAQYEDAYRAQPEPRKITPFEGACNEVMPVIAMAVDPIAARLSTGIFKQDPVFTMKALRKSMLEYIPALTSWVDFNQRHRWHLRQLAAPRFLEFTKLGTMIFKTVYEREVCKYKTYDRTDDYKIVTKEVTKYRGPKIYGISLDNLLFPASYQFLQDCPFIAERQLGTYNEFKRREYSKQVTNVDRLKRQGTLNKNEVEEAREAASNHQTANTAHLLDKLEVYECWFEFDVDSDPIDTTNFIPGERGGQTRTGTSEQLVALYHPDTKTLLSLRYNWYFHQRKPYTLIPYMITNNSLYGLGLSEMILPFQIALTRWHQMAQDNAYLANIRMFVAKKGSGIEAAPRLFAGRTFFVEDPSKDFKPFQAGEIYNSTLGERQNLFGLVEKRTGVSDYLTGRESPIVGSRATATSTLALIQEGTKRVEEVLENIRHGFAEILENCFNIWIQYGTEDVEELIFGDDVVRDKIKEFFAGIKEENVNGAFAVDLAATDASGNRQVLQQMQLSIIQTTMTYLEKLLEAGKAALDLRQTQPEMVEMIKDVMKASRGMFKDLLHRYDIRNPEDYLPDLEKYLNAQPGGAATQPVGGAPSGPAGGLPGAGQVPSLAPDPAALAAAAGGGPGPAGGNGRSVREGAFVGPLPGF